MIRYRSFDVIPPAATGLSWGAEHTATLVGRAVSMSMGMTVLAIVMHCRTSRRHLPGERLAATTTTAVRMVVARSALLEPLHFPALLLILGDILVPLAISRMARRDGTFLLLAGLTQQRAQALDLKLELATVIMVLRDSLGDLFIFVLPVV